MDFLLFQFHSTMRVLIFCDISNRNIVFIIDCVDDNFSSLNIYFLFLSFIVIFSTYYNPFERQFEPL